MANMHRVTTLTEHIITEERKYHDTTGTLTLLLTHLEDAAKIIASHVKRAGLADILGRTGGKNSFNEDVQKLDEFSNDLLIDTLKESRLVKFIASEELEKPIEIENTESDYTIYLDPLDGSSNIDVNVTIGTIFSIYKQDTFTKGANQVASGYIMYGTSVMFVYTSGQGVNGFTLDPAIGTFLLSHPLMTIPKKSTLYSINEGNMSFWDEKMIAYINRVKKNAYSLRYVGSMIADIHRTLIKGGIFLYPADTKNPNGKLRLMYEVNPIAYLITQAGGSVFSAGINPLDITPSSLTQRVPFICGSTDMVNEFINLTG